MQGDDAATPGADSGIPGTDGGQIGHDGGTPPPPSGMVDPSCTDGMYRETPPDTSASLSDITFTDGPSFVDAVLARRYPFGASEVTGGRMSSSFSGDCSVVFSNGASDAAGVYRALDTIVHECGHLADGRLSAGQTNAYLIQSSTTFMCTRGDTVDRGGDTFARSRIRGDSYQASRAPCTGGGAIGCDIYADVYLDGNPDDSTFQGGDQGFNMLLEEAVQYANSLVTAYAYADQQTPGLATTARDGILTMLWYVERYLHMARVDYPSAYSRISGDTCWRDAILTVWGRAWLFLELTADEPSLGIDDDAIESLVSTPELLDEIQRIRDASGC